MTLDLLLERTLRETCDFMDSTVRLMIYVVRAVVAFAIIYAVLSPTIAHALGDPHTMAGTVRKMLHLERYVALVAALVGMKKTVSCADANLLSGASSVTGRQFAAKPGDRS